MGLLEDVKTLVGNKPPQVSPQKPATQLLSASKKILIVEDDQMLREFYVDLMEQEGYQVLQAVNGEQGLATATSEKPNLIILDLMMPIMDGKTMLVRLRKIPGFEDLPVIILTNAGSIDNMRETQMGGNADLFFTKSNIDPKQLIGAVKDLV